MQGLSKLFDWVAKLAYLNVLWIVYTALGLVIFGVGPATVSVFTIIRKWLRNEEGFSIWSRFNATYKEEFWRANKLMLVIIPVLLFIYVDLRIIQALPESFLIDKIVFPAVILLGLLVMVAFSYVLAVFVHYDLPYWTNFKNAVLIAGLFPLSTILMVFGLTVFLLIAFIFPAIIPFYLVSVPALIIQLCALRGFRKLSSYKAKTT